MMRQNDLIIKLKFSIDSGITAFGNPCMRRVIKMILQLKVQMIY